MTIPVGTLCRIIDARSMCQCPRTHYFATTSGAPEIAELECPQCGRCAAPEWVYPVDSGAYVAARYLKPIAPPSDPDAIPERTPQPVPARESA